jgi:hypothetical protein
VLFSATATLVMQRYVGGRTIYAPELAARRDSLHRYILTNTLPPGRTWKDFGALGMNARILPVYLAEQVHRRIGWTIQRTYLVGDTLALFASMLALFALLRLWVPPPFALVGLLYYCAILPATYFFHYFHPSDRISFLIWIGLVYFLKRNRMVSFAALLALGMAVKYDMVLLPGLYLLANLRKENALRVIGITLALFALSFGLYEALVQYVGLGLGHRNIGAQLLHNLADIRMEHVWYPPFLALSLPLLLAVVGFREADRFARAALMFGLLFALPLFVLSNFIELRADMPVFLLLLPCAVIGLRALLSTGNQGGLAIQATEDA